MKVDGALAATYDDALDAFLIPIATKPFSRFSHIFIRLALIRLHDICSSHCATQQRCNSSIPAAFRDFVAYV